MHAEVFQALSDPTRRRIVAALLAGEQQVGELVEKAGVHQSGVSRHLRILHEAGMVSMRPVGPCRFYALRPEPFRALDGWLRDYRKLWEPRVARLATALEQTRVQRRAQSRSKRP